MQLLAVGLNHNSAPISLREKVAFPADQLGQAVGSACAWFSRSDVKAKAPETAILSTCNRTEVYAIAANPTEARAAIVSTLCAHSGLSVRELDELAPALIWVEEPPPDPEWEGVRDRLRRAAAPT